MRTNFRNLIISMAVILFAATSCSKDDNCNTGGETGTPANVSLNIYQLGAYQTREDGNATTDETALKTVNVFIYNANTGQLTHQKQLVESDFVFEAAGNGTYVGQTKIPTTTGPKNIYVGINLSPALVAAVIEYGPTAINTVSHSNELTSAVNGFAMFSVSATSANLVENDSDPANKVNIEVKRLVAKASIQMGSGLSLNVSGGLLSEMQFNMHNANKRFFPLPLLDGGSFKDPNWTSQSAGVIAAADFYNDSDADYVAVNLSTVTDNKLLNVRYALENTSEDLYEDENTFVSIRAKFVPSTVVVYTNGSDASGGFADQSNIGQPAATFYRVPLADGTSAYTLDADIATDYANDKGVALANIKTYFAGYCYYNVFLNKNNAYNVYRNEFYKATITSINGLGNPTQNDNGHVLLELPTNITVDIQIVPWQLVDFETQLPGS